MTPKERQQQDSGMAVAYALIAFIAVLCGLIVFKYTNAMIGMFATFLIVVWFIYRVNFKTKPRVYVCGKISGLPKKEVDENFYSAAERIKSFDLTPVIPLNNVLPDNAKWKDHMRADIELMYSCDMVAVLPNHKDSRGAKLEIWLAKRYDIPVVYLDD